MPNSGRYVPVYFCTDLHISYGCGYRQFGLVIQNLGIPNANYSLSLWNALARCRARRVNVMSV